MASAEYVFEIFSGLVRMSPDLEVVPDLAESWEITQDGRKYTFTLRPDNKFHDGRFVTAEDVVYSLERACDPATQSPVAATYLDDVVGCMSKLAGDATSVTGVEAFAPLVVAIEIDAPKAYFLSKLTYPVAFVVDRRQVASGSDWQRLPNGTGPFKIAEHRPRAAIVLERHDAHWKRPLLDEVDFDLAPADSLSRYENGELDAAPVGPSDLSRVTDPLNPLSGNVVQGESLALSYLAMRVDRPPFDDPLVRRAVYRAVDRRRLIEVILGTAYEEADGILPPAMPGHQTRAETLHFDAAAAQDDLDNSSYAGHLPPIRITVPGEGGVSPAVQALADDLEEHLGLEVVLETALWETFQTEVANGAYEMWMLGWEADYPDPQDFLDVLFHSKAPLNYTGFADPTVDRLLEEARIEPSPARRWDLYASAERRILAAAPWVPLYFDTETWLVASKVHGFEVLPLAIPRLDAVWIDD